MNTMTTSGDEGKEKADFKSGTAAHEYRITPGSTNAFPMSRNEVKRFCERLRNVIAPLFSHETWAATLLGLGVGLLLAWKSLPDPTTHEYLRASYFVGFIASGLGFVILTSLAVNDRKRTKTEPSRVADELEDMCKERMGKNYEEDGD